MTKIKLPAVFILLSIVIFISLGKTLSYYFFTDDYAFLYYLGHNLDFGWPYTSVLPLFRPIYLLFRTDPFPYLLLALVTYFLASLLVFLVAKSLTKNKLIAILSSLVFATGYIGLEQFSLVAVSIINNINVINVSIAIIFLIRWIDTEKPRYYFLTIVAFWISIALFPYRAYPLILFLPTIEFMKIVKFQNIKNEIKKIFFLVIRYIPFLILANSYGIFTYGTFDTPDSSSNSFLGLFLDPSSKIFTLFNVEFIQYFFGTFGKLFFIIGDFNNYFVLGFLTFLLIFATSVILILKKREEGRNLIIVLFLTFQSYFGNMFLHIDFAGNGAVNRYLTITFLPFSILVVLFFYILFSKLKFRNVATVIATSIIIITLSFLSREYEGEVIKERGEPAKMFFRQLKSHVPSISNNSHNVFYFDRASYYPVSSRFGNVLLSAAMSNSVNLAVPYGVDAGSVKIVDTFDQFLKFLIFPPPDKRTAYFTFYNDEKGLQKTTREVFSLLGAGKSTKIPSNQMKIEKKGNSSLIKIHPEDVSSLTPIRAKILLRSLLVEPNDISLQNSETNKKRDERSLILEYLLSKDKYYRGVNVETESIHIAKLNPPSYLVDKKGETVWLSDQSRWEVKIKPWIRLDLSEIRNIGRIIWRELPTRRIDKFTISTSLDGQNWTKLSPIKKEQTFDPDLRSIDFESISARFVLITIDELASGSPGPGLAEVEIVEDKYKNIDIGQALIIEQNPLGEVEGNDEVAQTFDYLKQNAKLGIKVKTNRDDLSSNLLLYEIPIFLDGLYHEYQFDIPPGGTRLKNLTLEANFPADFSIDSVILENRKLVDLKNEIREKCDLYADLAEWQNPFDCN